LNKLIKSAGAAALFAANLAVAADLTIHIDNVKAAAGTIKISVFTSEGTFLKSPAKGGVAAASLDSTKVVIRDLPEGDYAFAVYHDANANGKMDKNMFGIPTEASAFSNNAVGKMGPPSYANAKFALPAEGASVRVSLK
jgi:uncharacterized protein (DUF2141 family)